MGSGRKSKGGVENKASPQGLTGGMARICV